MNLNLERDDKSVYYTTQNGQEIDEDYVEKVTKIKPIVKYKNLICNWEFEIIIDS